MDTTSVTVAYLALRRRMHGGLWTALRRKEELTPSTIRYIVI
jgi:hypothetical protein